MIALLFLVLFGEAAALLLLMLDLGPLREVAMDAVSAVKAGRGPATVKTLACTLTAILASSVASILKIQRRGGKLGGGGVSPMDQVLCKTHLLEAALIGYILFLAFVVDRFHHYLREAAALKKAADAAREDAYKLRKENRALQEKEERSRNELRKLRQDAARLTGELQELRLRSEESRKKAVAAEARATALQKQFEELFVEHGRLLEDNQILQAQAMAYR